MSQKRYITLQIIPDDSSDVWTLKLRYRFFEFLFYAITIALFAVALAAVKITEINGKVLTANHLATMNKQLMEKQEKMAMLEEELAQISEQERKIRGIVETFITEKSRDSVGGKDVERSSRFSASDLEKYVADVRALEKKAMEKAGHAKTAFPGKENTPDIWPVAGIVSQPYNVSGSPEARHEGIDIIAEMNALVMSAAAGIVVQAGQDRDLGRFVKIDHDFHRETLYAHLSRSFVQVGDHVGKGTTIGTVGNTGNSYGPHLHYEILVKGKSVDPQQYLK